MKNKSNRTTQTEILVDNYTTIGIKDIENNLYKIEANTEYDIALWDNYNIMLDDDNIIFKEVYTPD